LPAFKSGKRIAVYLPFDRETDTAALLAAARRRGVRLYVPVVVDLRHRRLRFYPLDPAGHVGGHSASRSPMSTPYPSHPRWFNLIVVPLVGVDGTGGA
jgi:5-formyltetrahydrofolate cyclo-ligase